MIRQVPIRENLNKSISRLQNEIEKLNGHVASTEIMGGGQSDISDCTMFAVRDRGRIIFREYSKARKNDSYLRKESDRFYTLARRKYLELLIRLLEYKQDPASQTLKEYGKNADEMDRLIADFEKSGVDFARIMLSDEQYAWAKANYRKKKIGSSIRKRITPAGVETRSKSEQKLGSRFEYFGLPYRYEMKLRVNVEELVEELEEELKRSGWLKKTLFYYDGYECVWNVPPRYAWMNERGSMWKSFDAKTNEITIFPDFIFKLRDGSLLVWEHEGMALNFRYRCNASERIFVLRETGTIAENNLVFSFERDVNSDEELDRMIMTHLIPRILF